MSEKSLRMKYFAFEDGSCTIEFETDYPQDILQRLYLHMMGLSAVERILCLEKCLND